jgi:hypothetical protein
MGGGGHVIIRNRIRDTASDSTVLDHCNQSKRARLEEILAKNVADWTDDEFNFVIRRIVEAQESFC